MTWTALANIALVSALIILGGAITLVLTGLDRRLDEWREQRSWQAFLNGEHQQDRQ